MKQKLWAVNDAWNQKANDVGKELEEEFKMKVESMNPEEHHEFHRNYGWIRQNQERREKEREIREQNYEERKKFYLELFKGYPIREYSFLQTEFRKRLIEQFKEEGREICDNNIDDNGNGKIDCEDEQCRGQICGRGTKKITEGNETKEIIVDFYCIAGECKAKEQILEVREPVCGDHICEGNETIENCPEDCAMCPEHEPIECAGKVIFKGQDKNNCPLEPVCIEESKCISDEDCRPLCGIGKCVEGECIVEKLEKCSERECEAGTQKIMDCESGERIISRICTNGLWLDTRLRCPEFEDDIDREVEEKETVEEEIIKERREREVIEDVLGNACTTRKDCGRENDVCSNGQCVSIPENKGTPEEKISEKEVVKEEIIDNDIKEEEVVEEKEKPEIIEKEPEEPQESPEPEPESTGLITGQIIKKMSGFIISITGFSIKENDSGTEEESKEIIEEEIIDDSKEEEVVEEKEDFEDDYIERDDEHFKEHERHKEEYDRKAMEERRQQEEHERREREMRERCEEECKRPCVEKCVRDNCGEKMECNVDEEIKKCEEICQAEASCVEKCMKGEDWWKDFDDKEMHKEQVGVFKAGGSCRTSGGKTEGFIWFGGWGDSFEKIQPLKNKYYSGGHAEWCEFELENLINQRKEFEKGFNQGFAQWFFEDYLANSAENWEQAVSGIFELYWKNIENQMQMAFMMNCLGENDINEFINYNLIEINYEKEYGKIEYWEEAKSVKIPGMEERVTIISPYMKIWVFPSKEFIKYEMKKSMENHEFPGPPESKTRRRNEGGLTSEEKEMIREDRRLMRIIDSVVDKHQGNMNLVFQIVDFSNKEIIFNLYVQINENDLIKIEPMPPEEVPSKDVTVKIDFEEIYEFIYFQETNMKGEMLESPPWDRRIQPIGRVKDMVNGVRMYFRLRRLINSAEITPSESEKDIKSLIRRFVSVIAKDSNKEEMDRIDTGKKSEDEEVWEKRDITGRIISDIY